MNQYNKMIIPKILQNESFRFYLVASNGKIPIEKAWNTMNNYKHDSVKLQKHIRLGGNYGIVTGTKFLNYAHLIILDFDSLDYFNQVKKRLPQTFTVQTASSKLFHKYYYLKGELVRKIGIDSSDKKRLLDIQSDGAGIVAPGSKIGNNTYKVIENNEISLISLRKLEQLFEIKDEQTSKPKTKLCLDKTKYLPDKIKESVELLIKHKLNRTRQRHFQCPLHESSNKQDLYVMDDGSVFCFNCKSYSKTAKDWINKYFKEAKINENKQNISKRVIRLAI